MQSSEHRWELIFNLAWEDNGFVVDLTKVPDHVLDNFLIWRNRKVDEENARLK